MLDSLFDLSGRLVEGVAEVRARGEAPRLRAREKEWAAFNQQVNDTLVRSWADGMVESGLLAAGYRYLLIDDGCALFCPRHTTLSGLFLSVSLCRY